MFPPADDPPDLGIPPNRGPLPVRETLTLNLTLAFVLAIDAMPGCRGFGGSELTEGSHPTAPLYPSGQTLAFVPTINAMPGRRGFWGPELTEALYLRSEMRIGVRRPRLALVSFCFENRECLRENLVVVGVALGIELLGFDMTALDLCGLILI
ncbi:hypothetical protein CK203_064452 [Vitis vinifera]|uniref:Uncharacterized protein n=1 Tax=Vitis vinifera TaxID=29760 RepID=A0A438GAB5_VITVI|nr:hypothetical protein CK203_064452 [Vitis vinifera]